MSKRLAELRLYVRDGIQYALVGWLDYSTKGDIYCGPNPTVDGRLDSESHRFSYHASGVSIIRSSGFETRGLKRVAPFAVKGFERLTSNSESLLNYSFSARLPKQETKTRKNLVLEKDQLRGGIVTFDSWVVESGKMDLVDAGFAEYESVGCEILGCLRADWCEPSLGLTLYTMSEKSYASFQDASGGVGVAGFVMSDGRRGSPNAAARRTK